MVLATDSELVSRVEAPADQLSLFGVYPSPDGSELAVTVTADSSTPSDGGLVVLDRDGHVVGDVPAGLGPSLFSSPVWSPDGRSLAYVTHGSQGSEVAMWEIGGSTVTIVTIEQGSVGASGCLWAADGGGVLYSSVDRAAPGTSQFQTHWTVVLRNGATYQVPGGGYPLAWIAASP